MDVKRKKIEKIYLIVTIIIILAIIAAVIFVVINKKEPEKPILETRIDLLDNSLVKEKLKESEYKLFNVNIEYQALGMPVKFSDYDTKYITLYIGKNKDIVYKNLLKSIILIDVKGSTVEQVASSMGAYREKVNEFLKDMKQPVVSQIDMPKKPTDESDETSTTYEKVKSGEYYHQIFITEEERNYEIMFYEENNQLIGEISCFFPKALLQENNHQVTDKEGVG